MVELRWKRDLTIIGRDRDLAAGWGIIALRTENSERDEGGDHSRQPFARSRINMARLSAGDWDRDEDGIGVAERGGEIDAVLMAGWRRSTARQLVGRYIVDGGDAVSDRVATYESSLGRGDRLALFEDVRPVDRRWLVRRRKAARHAVSCLGRRFHRLVLLAFELRDCNRGVSGCERQALLHAGAVFSVPSAADHRPSSVPLSSCRTREYGEQRNACPGEHLHGVLHSLTWSSVLPS
jgi:hypothetical protein